MAAAAVRHAEKPKIRINVAVVDAGGNLAAFLRMPGGFLHSIDIAIDKAYTAAGSEFPRVHGQARSSRIPRPCGRACRGVREWCASAVVCRSGTKER